MANCPDFFLKLCGQSSDKSDVSHAKFSYGNGRQWALPLFGLLISLAAMLAFSHFQNQAHRAEFRSLSENRSGAIVREVEQYTDLLKALQAFADGSHVTDWNSMHRFVTSFAHTSKDVVRYYWWDPAANARAAQPLDAYPDDPANIYAKTELFDRLLRESAKTSLPASEIVLGPQPACVVALPTRSPQKAGVVSNRPAGVILAFRIADLMDDALGASEHERIGLVLHVADGTVLNARLPVEDSKYPWLARILQPSVAFWGEEWPIKVADLRWTMTARPGPTYLPLSEIFPRWGVFVLTLLIFLLVGRSFERRRLEAVRVELLAQQRTAELLKTKGNLREQVRDREQAEASLRENQGWLRFVQESVGIGVWDWDVAARHARFSPGQRQLNILDSTDETFNLSQWLSNVHPEDREPAYAEMSLLLSGAPRMHEVQYRVVAPDGQVRWLMTKGHAVDDAGGRVTQIQGATLDITGLKQTEQALRDSDERFHKAYLHAAVGMLMCDSEGRILVVNRTMIEISGYSESEMIGSPVNTFLFQGDREESARAFTALMRGDVSNHQSERRIIRKDGTMRWLRLSVSALESQGRRTSLIALCEDISEQVASRENLAFQANHDALTGLPNRRAFETRLADAIKRSELKGDAAALVYIDLDGFKLINDSLGHSAGDKLLKAVAERLNASTKLTSGVARVGGDEFTVILEGVDHLSALAEFAKGVIRSLEFPFQIGDKDLFVSASIGVSCFPRDGLNVETLLQHADVAMYQAKHQGKGRFCFFSQEMRDQATVRLELKSNLRRAIDRSEMEVFFQPLFDAGTRQIVRFEALCRWKSAEAGYIPPDKFIPMAEETGLIVPLGNFVLLEACRQAVSWNRLSPEPIAVAVNVSAVQFVRADFVSQVLRTLGDTGLRPSLLELELTESIALCDVDSAAVKLQLLRAAGVKLAMDDFGTGYSSLSSLQKLPFDTLKLDRSFIHTLVSDPGTETLIGSLITLAHGLGLRVVSEGVETEEQATLLEALGCDELQGFLLGRPESSDRTAAKVVAAAAVANEQLMVA